MMDFMQASDAIRNLAKLFKHMEGAADALEAIGSLEQAVSEKRAIIVDLDAKIKASKDVLQKHETATVQAQNMTDNMMASARTRADAVIDEAQANAAQVAAKAQEDAAKVLTATRQKAEKIETAARLEADRATVERDACLTERNTLAKEVADKNVELKEIEGRINAARAQISKMLGE